jgi:hypothetical protein
MAILDELKKAATNALSAGATAARQQGTALTGDFVSLARAQLEDVLEQIASIAEDYTLENISKDQAHDDIQTQCHRIKPIVLGIAELATLAVQQIIDAILDALKATVNAAAGVALL